MSRLTRVESYHLLRDHHDRLDRESPVAVIKEIFQTWPKEINDQYIVKSFLAEVVDIGYSSYENQYLARRQEHRTHGSQPISCTSGIHLAVVVHRFSSAPKK